MFRLQAKNIFLTYTKFEMSHDLLFNELNDRYPLDYAIICTEEHKDGEKHMHAAIILKNKPDIRNERTFDMPDCHPNIGKVKSLAASIQYCKKAGVYTEYGTCKYSSKNDDNLVQICTQSTFQEWCLYCLAKKIPFGYCQAIWNSTVAISNVVTGDYAIPIPELPDAIVVHTPVLFDDRSIVIVGPSGAGKTTYAMWMAPKPALVVTHMDDLRNLTNQIKSIVFDDMSFVHLPRESQIHLVDRALPRSIHCRYRTATIPAKMVKIFTANFFPFSTCDEAINRRINLIQFY